MSRPWKTSPPHTLLQRILTKKKKKNCKARNGSRLKEKETWKPYPICDLWWSLDHEGQRNIKNINGTTGEDWIWTRH